MLRLIAVFAKLIPSGLQRGKRRREPKVTLKRGLTRSRANGIEEQEGGRDEGEEDWQPPSRGGIVSFRVTRGQGRRGVSAWNSGDIDRLREWRAISEAEYATDSRDPHLDLMENALMKML